MFDPTLTLYLSNVSAPTHTVIAVLQSAVMSAYVINLGHTDKIEFLFNAIAHVLLCNRTGVQMSVT